MENVGAILAGACLAFIFAGLQRINTLEERVANLAHVNAKLDALLKHAGIDFDPTAKCRDQILDALSRGKKIEAIKHYRAATGAGLKEAKDYVEGLQLKHDA